MNKRELEWTEESRKALWESRFFRLLETEQRAYDGRTGLYYFLDCPDWVNVAALGPDAEGRDCLLMVRQYRHAGREVSLEFPGGVIEPGEDPLRAAKRELLEETGFEAASWTKLGDINPNPSFMCNRTHAYLARDLSLVSGQNLDPGEIVDFEMVPTADLRAGRRSDFEVSGIMLVTWYWLVKNDLI